MIEILSMIPYAAKSMLGSLTLDISHGIEIKEINDPILEVAEKGVQSSFEIANAGAYLGRLRHYPTTFPYLTTNTLQSILFIFVNSFLCFGR